MQQKKTAWGLGFFVVTKAGEVRKVPLAGSRGVKAAQVDQDAPVIVWLDVVVLGLQKHHVVSRAAAAAAPTYHRMPSHCLIALLCCKLNPHASTYTTRRNRLCFVYVYVPLGCGCMCVYESVSLSPCPCVLPVSMSSLAFSRSRRVCIPPGLSVFQCLSLYMSICLSALSLSFYVSQE